MEQKTRQEEIKEMLRDRELDETILFENPSYDTAVIGISSDDRLIYDFNKMVQYLVDTDGMTDEEAIEFIEYNTLRAMPYFGPKTPIVMYDIPELCE